ncbi:MAG: hypothetical protein LUG16_05055 [Candidatus Gastranaerophilales bacterium]|nr:hypothetical protein [Candidatus Gastranaerophilales bacterium]
MIFIKEMFQKYIKKFVHKKRNNENSLSYGSPTTKYAMNSCCNIKLSSLTEKKKNEINEKLYVIVKKYINYPEKLIQYIRLSGANVYKVKNAEKYLSNIGEEEGFITPLKGFKALYINLLLYVFAGVNLKAIFSTNEMFIFNEGCTEIYTIARAFHKYYGFKYNLPGYDYKSQEIFKKVYGNNKRKSSILNSCSIKDIYACKEAIARDLESINFTIHLSEEYEGSKKALKKIKENNSANV